MSEPAHSRFSASASSRWLRCPGSIQAEEALVDTDKSSDEFFAQEGTIAHEIASHCLETNVDSHVGWDFLKHTYPSIDKVMVKHVQSYLDYVRAIMGSDMKHYIERRVHYDAFIPDGFGTADVIAIDHEEKKVHVIDFKYGSRNRVEVKNNTQFQLYALGVLFGKFDVDNDYMFHLHVFQPRMNNINEWIVDAYELIKFGKWANLRAYLAMEDNPVRIAGDIQCKYCRAKQDCREAKEYIEDALRAEFDYYNPEDYDPKAHANRLTKAEKKKSLIVAS